MAATDESLAGAWQVYHRGDLASARAECERLLDESAEHVGALFLAGLIDYERGAAPRAIERLKHVVELRPDYAEAHNNLGNALAADGQLVKAEAAFREALRRKPKYAEAWNNLGNALRDQRRFDEAIEAYAHALELEPEYAECHNNLGIALARKKLYEQAAASYRRAIELKPMFPEPHNNLGIVLATLGQRAEAMHSFQRAIDRRPKYVDALANLALALADSQRFDEAAEAYQRAILLAPSLARLHHSLALVHARRGDLEAAIAALRRAIEAEPGYAEAHNNLGNALREMGLADEAERHIKQALTLKPDYREAHVNLGLVMVEQRRTLDAVACYDRALRQKRGFAEAHFHRALAWLANGDFHNGWLEYEWRWRTGGLNELACLQPRWDGGLIDGKTVLIWAEQEAAHTFQFVRYTQLVRQRGGRVLLRAPRPLHAILSRTPGIERLLCEDEPLPQFDCHVPLLSLPRLFGTTLDDVPHAAPYLFPDEQLVERWRGRVAEHADPSFTIGIAWQDASGGRSNRRCSPPLDALLELAGIPGVRLVSLRKVTDSQPSSDAGEHASVAFLGEDLNETSGDFMNVAAIMTNLDVVICPDGAIAHLAGALGVPAGVLLPYAADWRWLIDAEQSPWYPTLKLFRQPAPGDWQTASANAAQWLRELVARRVPGQSVDRYPGVARGWLDRGVHLAERGKMDEAVLSFRRALRFQPDMAEAYSNLGNALRAQGRLDEAIENLERALALSPDYSEAHHNLGIVFARQRCSERAIAQFERAIEIKPEFTSAWISLGLAQAEMRRYDDAEKSFRRALALEPQSPRILNNLGNALSDQGRREDAVAVLRRAIEIDPRCVDAHNNLGNALRELGRRDEAIASLNRAIAIRPEFAEAHNNLGIAWASKGDFQRAMECYHEALRIWPDYPAAHNNLGIALGHEKRFTEAIASYRRALQLKADYAEAHNNLGIALSQEGEYDEALACFKHAIELKPDYAEAFSNRGITLTELGQLEEALASYNEALRRKEKYPDARMNRALAFLVRGDFERGWLEYESRWQCNDFNPRNFKKPRWSGEPLEGRRVLLHAEQGFGDTFQFVRYARMVKEERGGRVIVWCPRPLLPLVSQCPYVEQVTIEGEKLPEFDCHLPLLSLPKVFGTTLDNVPSSAPYLFAQPDLIAKWREEFSYISAFKIGINWQGNPRYRGDRHRSIPLKQFAPLARIPGVRLISLQKGHGSEQVAQESANFSVTELGAHRDEQAGAFMDTAAILMNLDLVISSDTSLVHLAGGLGAPIWVALPWAADWRWLLKRHDCPWYPTMRLFRQDGPGNWEYVFDRICHEVRRLVAKRKDGHSLFKPVAPEDLLDQIVSLEVCIEFGGNNGSVPDELHHELAGLKDVYCRGVTERQELCRLREELRNVHESVLKARHALHCCQERGDGDGSLRLLKSIDMQEVQRTLIKKDISVLLSVDLEDGMLDTLACGRSGSIREGVERSRPQ